MDEHQDEEMGRNLSASDENEDANVQPEPVAEPEPEAPPEPEPEDDIDAESVPDVEVLTSDAESAFKDLLDHDSTPSIPLGRFYKTRFSQTAKDLENARVQAYIEANLGARVLELLQTVIPMIAGGM